MRVMCNTRHVCAHTSALGLSEMKPSLPCLLPACLYKKITHHLHTTAGEACNSDLEARATALRRSVCAQEAMGHHCSKPASVASTVCVL
jgi:hypothetical protein